MEDLLAGSSIGLNIVASPNAAPKRKIETKKKNAKRKNGKPPSKSRGKPVQSENKESNETKTVRKNNNNLESTNDEVVDHPFVQTMPVHSDKTHSPYVSADELQSPTMESKDDQSHASTDSPPDLAVTSALPQDVEERARYLAEFHARPLELDRRSGATRKTVRSRDSEHLFRECNTWGSFQLHERLQHTLKGPHFQLERPTVIQSKALPIFQQEPTHNIMIQSETGSGKTLAYLLPILQALATDPVTGELSKQDRLKNGTRCLILCPTRELASQTLTVLEKLCSQSFHWLVPGCLFGDEKRKSEKARIRKGLNILVATPGRLLDHLVRTESLLLTLKGKIQWIVLDEADRLLDMGLGEQVKQIIQRIRANQPGSGNNGITWRSVLVSATVTQSVEKLAQETLLGANNTWKWVKGGDDVVRAAAEELAESTPRQLSQLHMTVSAKLRLPALVAFLVQRVQKGERTVIFMSTCASVDFHHALFTAMDSILDDDDEAAPGMFGDKCPIYKLHGNVAHGERQLTLRRFMKPVVDGGKKQAAVLFATDVAARGLNLPDCDWTVQYDPPGEVADYVHRAGRVARAGKAGHSLLFLLPSEQRFLDILKKRGVQSMTALSLTSTLNNAAKICDGLVKAGVEKAGGGQAESSRAGEAFSQELQRRLEELVVSDDSAAKAAAREQRKNSKRKARKPAEVSGALLDAARDAFVSHIRAYPTKEKLVRHIFSTKALHLGHVARSFALKDPPKKLSLKVQKDKEERKRNKSMAFESYVNQGGDGDDAVVSTKRLKRTEPSTARSPMDSGQRMFAMATKIQANGLDAM